MIEIYGDLFKQEVDVICITTNATLKKDGRVVMGAGVALTAAKKWPEMPLYLGQLIKSKGNNVHSVLNDDKYLVWSFPVKHNYWEKADIKLIEQSCKQVVKLANETEKIRLLKSLSIVIPKPGCGAGHLTWNQVKPICEKYLDDRFFIIDKR